MRLTKLATDGARRSGLRFFAGNAPSIQRVATPCTVDQAVRASGCETPAGATPDHASVHSVVPTNVSPGHRSGDIRHRVIRDGQGLSLSQGGRAGG
jgi:hypothetical protein